MRFLQRLFGKRKETPDAAWQVPFIQSIAVAMLRSCPEDWNSAYLVLEAPEKGLGSGLAHSAITRQKPAGMALSDADFVMPNPDVMAETRQFELAWLERKGTFKRAIVSAVRDESGWEIRSDYEH